MIITITLSISFIKLRFDSKIFNMTPRYYFCGDTVWSPNPYLVKSWFKKAQHNEFCRVWVKELGLDKLNRSLHGIKEHTDKNKAIVLKYLTVRGG